MKQFFYLVFIVFICSCSTREEIIEQTFPNGDKKIVMIYEGSADDRVPVSQTTYYDNGKIEVTGNFEPNGQRTGLWTYYYKNGNKWSECQYDNGIRNGRSTTYFDNGNKRYEGLYTQNKQAGRWKFWNKEGKLETEKNY